MMRDPLWVSVHSNKLVVNKDKPTMTFKQIQGLKADVLGMLRDRVEDIFIDLQNAMEIKNGDVDPLTSLHLQQKEEQLAEMITEILVTQKGE